MRGRLTACRLCLLVLLVAFGGSAKAGVITGFVPVGTFNTVFGDLTVTSTVGPINFQDSTTYTTSFYLTFINGTGNSYFRPIASLQVSGGTVYLSSGALIAFEGLGSLSINNSWPYYDTTWFNNGYYIPFTYNVPILVNLSMSAWNYFEPNCAQPTAPPGSLPCAVSSATLRGFARFEIGTPAFMQPAPVDFTIEAIPEPPTVLPSLLILSVLLLRRKMRRA